MLPKQSTIAHAVVAPTIRPAVKGILKPEQGPQDRFTPQEEPSLAVELISKGAGVAAGTVTGLATTAICAANYPVAAICVGTATCAAILASKETTDLPVPKPAAALLGGAVAAAYAPAVAGAVVAVGTEELVTHQVEKWLTRERAS